MSGGTPSRAFARLAAATAATTVTLFGVGGLVRGTGSGLGCSTWPKCGPDRWLPYPNAQSLIEYAHRSVAAVVITLVAIQAIAAWRSARARRTTLVASLLAVPLVLAQAGLGGVVVLTDLNPWWLTFHFAVAMSLVATVVVAAVDAWRLHVVDDDVAPRGFARLAAWTAGTTFLLLLVGTYVRATDSGLAFSDWPLMDGRLVPTLGGAATAMFLHRVVALAAFLLVLWTCIRAWMGERPRVLAALSWTALTLMVGQVLVGALQVVTRLAAGTVALHVAMSAAIWAVLVALAVWARGMRAAPTEAAAAPLGDAASAPGVADRLMAYVRLTKPRIVVLLLITTVPAMLLAERGWPSLGLILATLLGGAGSAGAANAINCYLDRDIDEVMRRTRRRPLPRHELAPTRALAFGYVLAAVSALFLAVTVNVLAAALSLSAVFFYVFIYTAWLKRTSTQNIVIGGAAGAVPALVGWAAVRGDVGLPAWILFAIVFMWTPPHFWALAMRYRDDYAAAGVPMLPVVRGSLATRRQILVYSVLLVATSLTLVPAARTGLLYLVPAVVLGVVFVARAIALWRDETTDPMDLFRFSLVYLAALFAAVALDSVVVVGRIA
ncbi:MAG: heme o synthase [Actinomycetota bacterium]